MADIRVQGNSNINSSPPPKKVASGSSQEKVVENPSLEMLEVLHELDKMLEATTGSSSKQYLNIIRSEIASSNNKTSSFSPEEVKLKLEMLIAKSASDPSSLASKFYVDGKLDVVQGLKYFTSQLVNMNQKMKDFIQSSQNSAMNTSTETEETTESDGDNATFGSEHSSSYAFMIQSLVAVSAAVAEVQVNIAELSEDIEGYNTDINQTYVDAAQDALDEAIRLTKLIDQLNKQSAGWSQVQEAASITMTVSICILALACGQPELVVMAVSLLVLEETGVINKCTTAISNSLEQTTGISPEAAKILADVLVALSVTLLTLGIGAAAGMSVIAEEATVVGLEEIAEESALTAGKSLANGAEAVAAREAATTAGTSVEEAVFEASVKQARIEAEQLARSNIVMKGSAEARAAALEAEEAYLSLFPGEEIAASEGSARIAITRASEEAEATAIANGKSLVEAKQIGLETAKNLEMEIIEAGQKAAVRQARIEAEQAVLQAGGTPEAAITAGKEAARRQIQTMAKQETWAIWSNRMGQSTPLRSMNAIIQSTVLMQTGFWGDLGALCAKSTPQDDELAWEIGMEFAGAILALGTSFSAGSSLAKTGSNTSRTAAAEASAEEGWYTSFSKKIADQLVQVNKNLTKTNIVAAASIANFLSGVAEGIASIALGVYGIEEAYAERSLTEAYAKSSFYQSLEDTVVSKADFYSSIITTLGDVITNTLQGGLTATTNLARM